MYCYVQPGYCPTAANTTACCTDSGAGSTAAPTGAGSTAAPPASSNPTWVDPYTDLSYSQPCHITEPADQPGSIGRPCLQWFMLCKVRLAKLENKHNPNFQITLLSY